MVDPDNRRPVDWDERRETLAAIDAGAAVDCTNIKMHLIRRVLAGSGPDGARTLDLGPEVAFDQVRLLGWPVALLERPH